MEKFIVIDILTHSYAQKFSQEAKAQHTQNTHIYMSVRRITLSYITAKWLQLSSWKSKPKVQTFPSEKSYHLSASGKHCNFQLKYPTSFTSFSCLPNRFTSSELKTNLEDGHWELGVSHLLQRLFITIYFNTE